MAVTAVAEEVVAVAAVAAGVAWEACLGLAVVAALAPVQEESVVAEEVWGRRSAAYQLSLPSEMLSA